MQMPFTDEQAQGFMKLVAETAAWCTRQADANDPANTLRTFQPRPGLLKSRESQVGDIAWQRSERLSAMEMDLEPAADLLGGRLLAFDPEASLFDGMANIETGGFFDNDNVPPFDTWVTYVYDEAYWRPIVPGETRGWDAFQTYLVAWIPPVFVESVGYGIEVNPEECILWLDEMDTPFAQALRERGIFG